MWSGRAMPPPGGYRVGAYFARKGVESSDGCPCVSSRGVRFDVAGSGRGLLPGRPTARADSCWRRREPCHRELRGRSYAGARNSVRAIQQGHRGPAPPGNPYLPVDRSSLPGPLHGHHGRAGGFFCVTGQRRRFDIARPAPARRTGRRRLWPSLAARSVRTEDRTCPVAYSRAAARRSPRQSPSQGNGCSHPT